MIGIIVIPQAKKKNLRLRRPVRRRKILYRTAFLSWTVVLFAGAFFYLLIFPYHKEQLILGMKSKAKIFSTAIAQFAASSILLEDYSSVVDNSMNVVNENPSLVYVVITRKDGFSLIHKQEGWSQRTLNGKWTPDNDDPLFEGVFMKSGIVESPEVFHITFPFRYSGIEWGYIHVALSTDTFHRDLRTLYIKTGMIALLSLVIGLVASYVFSIRLVKPILMLNQVTEQIGVGDLSARVRIETGDEIEDLGNSVNKMAEALEKSQLELAETNKELIETARKAGMAEVATGVLHNVGNVLNSISISTASVIKRIRNSRVDNLFLISEQFEQNSGNLLSFLNEEDRAIKLQAFLSRLSSHLLDENRQTLEELNQLAEHIKHINEVVSFQQSFGKSIGVTEPVFVEDIIQKSVEVNSDALQRNGIRVLYNQEEFPPLLLDRHKVIQIVTNLLSNAIDALVERQITDRRIIITTKKIGAGYFQIKVSDNGIGITKENMTRIFNHGFTTKKNGHGYGLHSGALSAKEMKGSLSVYSDGPNKGADISLKLPLRYKDTRNEQRDKALQTKNPDR